MTSEFEFLEARLRRQLPELTDAYGAAPPQAGSERSVPLLGDDDVPLLPVPEPLPEPSIGRTSRLVLVASAAVILVVVGLLSTVFATRGNVSTTDPAGAPVAEVGEVEESALTVEADGEPTNDNPSTTSVVDDEVTGESTAIIKEDGNEEEPAATSQTDSETTASSIDTNAADDTDARPTTDANTATTQAGRGCVGNRVWEDLNGNGIQDGGEPGIVDTTISLFDTTGEQIDTQELVNGYFSLCGPVGNYRLSVAIPLGYTVTAADQGSSDHKDSDADATGSIELTVDRARKRSKYDIGLTNTNSESASAEASTKPAASAPSAVTPLATNSVSRPTRPAITATPVAVSATQRSSIPATEDATIIARAEPKPTPMLSNPSNRGSNDLSWGFWVETRNAYADNGQQPLVDRGVETTFENYSFAHVKANSLHGVNGDRNDRTYVVNVIEAAERTNTVLDLQLGSSGEYGWNFSTGRGNFSLNRWLDAVSRFGGKDRPSRAKSGTTIKGDPQANAAIQRAIDNGTIRYIFLIDEPNHKRWSPQWNGKHGSAATGSSNHVTNQMLDQMAAHTKTLWGARTQTIVRTSPTNLITGSRGMYQFKHMTHAYLTISSTKWMAGGGKGPGKGLEWFLTEKNNHTDGTTNFTAFNATGLQMSLMVQAGFQSKGNPWTGANGFDSRWWQGTPQYPFKGNTSYVKTSPGEMDYWVKSMLSKRHPTTGKLDSSGVRWIDDFVIFRADRLPTDSGKLPWSTYPHYRKFVNQLGADINSGNLNPTVGIPVGWQGD